MSNNVVLSECCPQIERLVITAGTKAYNMCFVANPLTNVQIMVQIMVPNHETLTPPRANSSISAMRPPCYYLLEKIVILGVIHGSSVRRVCNLAAPAAPEGPRGIPGLSPGWYRADGMKANQELRTAAQPLHKGKPGATYCRPAMA